MIQLHFAPRTRSARILWLLEELGLAYELVRGEFVPPEQRFFAQATPTGKFPTLVDGDVVMMESGAIVQYLLERYGEGRLEPAVGAPDRPAYLQWLHYAEATAFPPVGIVVWLTRYRKGSDGDVLIADALERAASGFDFLEQQIGDGPWLLGEAFTAADIMLGFTLVAATSVGALQERHPQLRAYLGRLLQRPALQKVVAESDVQPL